MSLRHTAFFVPAAVEAAPALYPLRRKWTRKPPSGVKIDLSNPISKGLVAAYVFDNAGRLHDLLGKHDSASFAGNPSLVTTPQGIAVHCDGALDDYTIPNHPELDFNNTSLTLCIGLTPQGSEDGPEFVEKQVGSTFWQLIASLDQFRFLVRAGIGTISVTSSTTWVNGRYYNVVARADVVADSLSIFVDGVSEATTSLDSQVDWSSSADVIIGGGNGGNPDVYLHYLYIFRAAKTDVEIRQLDENPYRIFQPRNLWMPLGVEEEEVGTPPFYVRPRHLGFIYG